MAARAARTTGAAIAHVVHENCTFLKCGGRFLRANACAVGEVCWGDSLELATGGARLGIKFTKLDTRSESNLLDCINTIRTTL